MEFIQLPPKKEKKNCQHVRGLLGAEELVQWIKGLLSKHKHLSPDSQCPSKGQVWQSFLYLRTGRARTCWSVSLPSQNSRL